MKISHIHSQILVLPEADPLANSPENPNAARPIVILRMGTDDGIEGIAVTFYGGAMTRSLKAAVDDLGALDDRRRPAAPRSDHRQTARRSRRVGAGRHVHPGAGGDRHRAVGHSRQGAEPAVVEIAGRGAPARRDLCERLAAPQPEPRRSRDRGRQAQGKRLSRGQDAARSARPDHAGEGGRARARRCARRWGPTSS